MSSCTKKFLDPQKYTINWQVEHVDQVLWLVEILIIN